MKKLNIVVETLSPLHLGGGKADVIVDAEVIHDEFGMPYFPAKRFKGLLYESAKEIVEISGNALIAEADLEKVFGHADGASGLVISNLYIKDYNKQREAWAALKVNFPGYFNEKDVLKTYTELRYSTKIDKATGTADDGSLHNMRLIDRGTVFEGTIELWNAPDEAEEILKLALANLRFAGAKRNRGCGHIKCTLV